MNIVGFHEFLVSQLKGDFVCKLGLTAKAICLPWNILVAKAKVLPLLDIYLLGIAVSNQCILKTL